MGKLVRGWSRAVTPTPAEPAELDGLKRMVIDSIPPVTGSDVYRRFTAALESLCYDQLFILSGDPKSCNSQVNLSDVNTALGRLVGGGGITRVQEIFPEVSDGDLRWGFYQGDMLRYTLRSGQFRTTLYDGPETDNRPFSLDLTPGTDINGSKDLAVRCPRLLDVSMLADDHGLSLDGLDVPKSVGLISLYSDVQHNSFSEPNAYSGCLGLRRVRGDPAGGVVSPTWCYKNHPEIDPGNSIVMSDDVTCFAKYHVVMPSDESPFILLYPVQFTRARQEDILRGFAELKAGYERGGDSDGVREIEHRRNLAYRSRNLASSFRHRDRNLVLCMVGLDIARASGISDIAMPSRELLLRPGELVDDVRDQVSSGGNDPRFMERYAQAGEFLRGARGFTVREWDG
ncbi:MAG: hypothetical protein GF416_07370 [Candidatus Altiarchaeales archaeon]|nr:hypothetical protein [Candidatus Altiarchaeales archaeon]MBD3416932.1 hypothetical protein [Candidatus Altiarchaeales archaeon]